MSLPDLIRAAASVAEKVLQYNWKGVLQPAEVRPAEREGDKALRRREAARAEQEVSETLLRLRRSLRRATLAAVAECPGACAEGAIRKDALSVVEEDGLGFIDALGKWRAKIRRHSDSRAEVLLRLYTEAVRKLSSRWQRLDESVHQLLALESGTSCGRSTGGGQTTRARQRTARGGAREKLVAALTKHHRYEDGSCLNLDPLPCNHLAKHLAKVAKSSASDFFKTEFGGYDKYVAVCQDAARLGIWLKQLNGGFSPHELFGRRPPGEESRHATDDE
jgi:hypothetical protein